MSSFNPYAPPLAPVEPRVEVDATTSGLWRDGTKLVVERDAAFPDRCVKCNAPVPPSRIRERSFHRHATVLAVLAPLNLLIDAVIAMTTGKRVRYRVGLCSRHLRWRRMAVALAWSWLPAAILLYFIEQDIDLSLVVFLGAMALTCVGVAGCPVLVARRIDDDVVRFTGAGEAFLASLPPLAARNAPPDR
jgi:hypothetical protein